MWRVQRTFLVGFSAWLAVLSLGGTADARIKTPLMEELVDGADLIVIGKVESVQATPPELWRQIGTIALWTAAVPVIAFLLWKKKVAIAACLAVTCLLLLLQCDVPFGTHRKVAHLSVSLTVKGPSSVGNIAIHYDDGFVCDVTHLDVGQEYLLFLRTLSSGYTMSWYDWSVWTIKGGCVQNERRAWHDAAPIPVAEFVLRIEGIRDSHQTK